MLCSLAEQKVVLRLGETELFTCPECARPLAPAKPWRAGRRVRLSEVGLALYSIAVAVGVIWWRWPDRPAPPPVVHLARQQARQVTVRPEAAPPPRVAAAPDRVILRIAVAPTVGTMLLPQLAAAYLAVGRDRPALIIGLPAGFEVRLQTAGASPAIRVATMVAAAIFDQLAQGQVDVACSDQVQTPAQRLAIGVQAEVVLAASPVQQGAAITCYARPSGAAADVMAWLSTKAARQIISAAGYSMPPPPLPAAPVPAPVLRTASPKPALPAPIARVSARAAKSVARGAQPAAAPVSPRPAIVASASASAAQTAPARSIRLPQAMAGFHAVYGPLKDVILPTDNPHMIMADPNAARVPGSVLVDCDISAAGVPSACRELSHTGNNDAAAAIMAWLPSGAVRYPPTIKDGHAVEDRRQLTVTFAGQSATAPQD